MTYLHPFDPTYKYKVCVLNLMNSEFLHFIFLAFNPVCANTSLHRTCQYTYFRTRAYIYVFSLDGYGKYLVQHSLTFRDIGLLSQMGFIKPTQFHISTSINPLSHNFSFLDSSPSVLSLYTNLEN